MISHLQLLREELIQRTCCILKVRMQGRKKKPGTERSLIHSQWQKHHLKSEGGAVKLCHQKSKSQAIIGLANLKYFSMSMLSTFLGNYTPLKCIAAVYTQNDHLMQSLKSGLYPKTTQHNGRTLPREFSGVSMLPYTCITATWTQKHYSKVWYTDWVVERQQYCLPLCSHMTQWVRMSQASCLQWVLHQTLLRH